MKPTPGAGGGGSQIAPDVTATALGFPNPLGALSAADEFLKKLPWYLMLGGGGALVLAGAGIIAYGVGQGSPTVTGAFKGNALAAAARSVGTRRRSSAVTTTERAQPVPARGSEERAQAETAQRRTKERQQVQLTRRKARARTTGALQAERAARRRDEREQGETYEERYGRMRQRKPRTPRGAAA